MKKTLFLFAALFLMSALLLSACGTSTPAGEPSSGEVSPSPEETTAPEVVPTEADTPPPTEADTPPPAEASKPLSNLPADPQRVEFESDGENMVGYFYPGKYENAPVVVLMHWAGGDMRDWCKIAPWLQNRLDESPAEIPGCEDAMNNPSPWLQGTLWWWDETWFPPLSSETSYAVFVFDFPGYGESARLDSIAYSPSSHAAEDSMDAMRAFEAAAMQPGVDPMRMVGAGASIGANGAPDGCLLYNEAHDDGRCVGAFSWSPGINYLGLVYADSVAKLNSYDPSVPVWCLASEKDSEAFAACEMASPFLAEDFMYQNSDAHGMYLIDPNLKPVGSDENSLELLLDFLDETVGEP